MMTKTQWMTLTGFLLAFGCSSTPETRTFHFEYSTSIGGFAPDSKNLRVWIPLPQDDEAQRILNLQVTGPSSHSEKREPLYGNRIAYFEVPAPLPPQVPIKVSFDVVRTETHAARGPSSDKVRARALEPDQLVATDGEVAARAEKATAGRTDRAEVARALYEKVLADVNYDKSGTGWGRGDTTYVCQAGKGNCSDFHALFIGMARSRKVPALFEIGFPLPRDKHEGIVTGYHCWAWYEERPGLWRPIDASEADKDPSRKEYFFGTLCCNRVTLSRGRDVILEPPQAGPPVNFFIYPYVEVDGKANAAKAENSFSFRDSGPSQS